jgi:hypothetical protein
MEEWRRWHTIFLLVIGCQPVRERNEAAEEEKKVHKKPENLKT